MAHRIEIDFGSVVDPTDGGTYRFAGILVLTSPIVLVRDKATAERQLFGTHCGSRPNNSGLVHEASEVTARRT